MREPVVRSVVGEGGGGSHSPASPSFLGLNKDNVNAQLYWAQSLVTLWDFREYKGRIGRTHVVLIKRSEPSIMKVMPASCKSRYSEDGRILKKQWLPKPLSRRSSRPRVSTQHIC